MFDNAHKREGYDGGSLVPQPLEQNFETEEWRQNIPHYYYRPIFCRTVGKAHKLNSTVELSRSWQENQCNIVHNVLPLLSDRIIALKEAELVKMSTCAFFWDPLYMP